MFTVSMEGIAKNTGKIKTTEWFIEKAKAVHGDKYDYSTTVYKGGPKKVDIICKEHGVFTVHASAHVSESRKAGCKYCGSKATTLEDFLKKSKEVHGDKYDYVDVEYVNTTTKVQIVCKEHGPFWQIPKNHIKGCGCPSCGNCNTTTYRTKSNEEFIEQLKDIYKDGQYTYENTKYTGKEAKVIVNCTKHGEFTKQAKSLLKGHACPTCSKLTNYSLTNLWSYSGWEQAGKMSKNFEGFSLYVIECSSKSTGERFIKVGKTFTGVANRFKHSDDMPYKFKVLTQVYHNAYAISKLEEQIKAKFKESAYLPKKPFKGATECLSLEVKDAVVLAAEE